MKAPLKTEVRNATSAKRVTSLCGAKTVADILDMGIQSGTNMQIFRRADGLRAF